MFAGAANANYLPSVRIGTAALINPSDADAYYGPSKTHTVGPGAPATRPPELVELARALKNDPDLIYEYVRNNIGVVWIYGLQKGALGAEIDKSGTPFDQVMLMVELLRQAGYTASYKAGTITLTGAQFTAWTGISDATAACQMLSSGAIPAIINGTPPIADCAYGTGTPISTVQFSHVWVSVVIGSGTYVFDPSNKPYTWKSGINLATATGLITGTPLAQASSGMDSGTASGASYVHNLNTESLNSTLQTYSSSLLSYLSSHGLDGAQMEDIVGGGVIQPYRSPPGGLRQTSLPYQSSTVQHTWTGDIPNQYRTTLQVSGTMLNLVTHHYDTMFNETFYADEIYGRRLSVSTDYNMTGIVSPDQYFPNTVYLQIDCVSDEIGAPPCATILDTYVNHPPTTNPQITSRGADATITLIANHPYAASADGTATTGGDYMDVTITKPVVLITPLSIVQGWGDASENLFKKWSGEQVQDASAPRRLNPPPCYYNPQEPCFDKFEQPTGDFSRDKVAADYLAQFTREAQLNANIAAATQQTHHVLGIVYGDVSLRPVYGINHPPAYSPDWIVWDNFDRIDVDAGISVSSKTADATARRVAVQTIAATGAAIEGGMSGQLSGLPDTTSTSTRFGWGNRPPRGEDPSGTGPRKFFQFDSSNASAAGAVALVDGLNAWSAPGGPYPIGQQPPMTADEAAQWKNALTTNVSDYATAGFTIVASQEAFLGPGQRGGAYELDGPGAYTPTLPTKQRGGAMVATRYVGGDPVEIANLVFGYSSLANGDIILTKGGGGGAQPDQAVNYDPVEAADILKAKFIDKSNALGVDLANGSLSYQSPASLTVGNGGLPYALSASQAWRAGVPHPHRFSPTASSDPDAGWSMNWQNKLSVSGSGMEAMGQSDIRAAAGAIVAFLATQDIFKSAQSPQRDVAAMLAQNWWVGQISGNVASVSLGTGSRQFLQLPSGSWIAPGPGFAKLTQTGSRTPYEYICDPTTTPYAMSRGWDNSGLAFTVTNAHGDAKHFSYWTQKYKLSDNDIHVCGKQEGFRLSTWSFPQGPTVTLNYTGDALTSVANNLGRALNYTYTATATEDDTTITDGTRTLTLTSPFEPADPPDIHTDPAGEATTFQYLAENDIPTPTARPVPFRLLQQVYTADNTSKPNVQYDYDALGRVEEVEDAVSLQVGGRNPYQFYIGDGTRGERDDPLGQAYTVVYDTYGHPNRYIDEVGAETDATFDSRTRSLQYLYPEGDCDVFAYDHQNNTTDFWRVDTASSCNKAAGSAHVLHASATWNQTWNQPLTVVNARGYTTTLAYYASGNGASLLHTATRPAIAEGTPVYSFTYDAQGKPLTSVVPLTATTNVTTANTYDATTEDLLTTTLDPTGVAALTAFGYDGIGNVTSVTDPRANVTTSLYDLDRRKTEDHRHNGNASAVLIAASKTDYDAIGRDIFEYSGLTFSGTSVASWQTDKSTTYTPVSKVATITDADNRTTTNTWDNADRLLTVADPVSRKTHFVYCALGDANCAANQVKTEYRAWVAGTGCTRAGTLQECYRRVAYYPDGEQQTITDANGNVTTYGYDGFTRLTQTTFPDTSYEQLTLDANANVTARRNRAGQTLSYTYNALDWALTKVSPNPAVTTSWHYLLDGAADMLSDTAGNTIAYGYDSAGRATSEANTIAGLTGTKTASYMLDQNGNRTRLTWPDGYYVNYDYDALNRMATATDSLGASLATYGYDTLSRRTNLLYGNGASMAYTYSPAGDLRTLNHDMAGSSNDPHFTYQYTNAHQLYTETVSDADYLWQPAANASTSYTPNNLNQYSTVASVPFAYDLKGNLTNDGVFSYTYDAENRMLTAGPVTTYAYDPLGRRTKKTAPAAPVWGMVNWNSFAWTASSTASTYFVDSGTDEIAEYSSAGALTTRYVPGPAIDEPIAQVKSDGTHSYFHTNRQGSVIAMSGAGAAKVEGPYTYDPYGSCFKGATSTPCDASGEPYRFTGRRLDAETGLYYYRARCYSPVLGRFCQTDPVGYTADLNLYTAFANDPTDKSDPSGTQSRDYPACDSCEPQSNTGLTADDYEQISEFFDAASGTAMGMGPYGAEAGEALKFESEFFKEEALVTRNAAEGVRREAITTKQLKAENPNASVQNQHYLRDANGKIVKDPITDTGRRVDHAVIEGGKARTFETTGPNVNKVRQLEKEQRIRDNGGTYVRDRNTNKLCPVDAISKVQRCP
ncbi:MAG TPA: RHS repeat-associated core domain-containing protein [Rhizomicrobium sp.]